MYDCSSTGYVARFMGGQNVLSGAWCTATHSTITIDSGGKHLALTASSGALAAGSDVRSSGAPRSDRPAASRPDPWRPGLNAVIGRVAAIEYQGTWLKITVAEACGEEFVVNLPDSVFFADPFTSAIQSLRAGTRRKSTS